MLLSGGNLVSTVHIEEADTLEKVLCILESGCTEVTVLHTFVEEKGKVPAHFGELGEFAEGHLAALDQFEKVVPVDLCRYHTLLDTELAG